MALTDRVIYHIDCNAFYASVEELFHPELKRVPMAVCGNPESRRGIILAKNDHVFIKSKFFIERASDCFQHCDVHVYTSYAFGTGLVLYRPA